VALFAKGDSATQRIAAKEMWLLANVPVPMPAPELGEEGQLKLVVNFTMSTMTPYAGKLVWAAFYLQKSDAGVHLESMTIKELGTKCRLLGDPGESWHSLDIHRLYQKSQMGNRVDDAVDGAVDKAVDGAVDEVMSGAVHGAVNEEEDFISQLCNEL
jgi:hypothetical protein